VETILKLRDPAWPYRTDLTTPRAAFHLLTDHLQRPTRPVFSYNSSSRAVSVLGPDAIFEPLQ
jgi:hypothetical protein